MTDHRNIATAILIGIILALNCVCAFKSCENEPIEPIRIQVDTLIVRDTIVVQKVQKVATMVVDTMYLPTIVSEKDTIYVPVPREQSIFEDSTFTAWVSGYKPSLDSIHIYMQSETITIRERSNPRWSIGASVGMAVTPQSLSPYIGIGLQYHLLNF